MSEELWFRMRPSKFMSGCRGLSANEVKVYISLICRIMEHGEPVEDDHLILSTYCEVRPSSFASALDRLVRLKKLYRTEDGRISNTFCDGEIAWRAGYSEKQKRAGEKSAEKRKENQATLATIVQPTFNQEDTDTDTEKNKNPPTPQGATGVVRVSASKLALVDDVLSTEFEKIWTHYPRRVGKATAFKAWRKARSRADYEVIAAPLRLCIRSWQNTPPDKIPHFATWLNRDGWLDDPAHAANRPQTSTEDLRRLGTITSSDDLAALFSTPQLRIAK